MGGKEEDTIQVLCLYRHLPRSCKLVFSLGFGFEVKGEDTEGTLELLWVILFFLGTGGEEGGPGLQR